MDQTLHQSLEVSLNAFGIQLHEFVTGCHQGSKQDMLLRFETGLFDLLLQHLGRTIFDLFLAALHQDQEWIEHCQEQARQSGFRNSGWRSTRVYSLFGGRHQIRTPYAVKDRRGQPGSRRGRGKRGINGSGYYPILEALGCRANATPALLSEVGSQLGWGPSEEAAKTRLEERGIGLDHKTLRRLFHTLADEALTQRDQALKDGKLPAGSQGESLAGKRAVICFDAGRVRTRVQHRGRYRQSGYHGFDGPWRAPRLMVIYAIDEKGRKKRHELPLYDGQLTCANDLFELMKKYLIALDALNAELLVFIADGAPEHWDRVVYLIKDLVLDSKRVVEVLDWAHAIENLTKAIDACGNQSEKKRRKWLDKQRHRLKKGQLSAVLAALKILALGRRAKTVGKVIAYFKEHAYRMRYDYFQSIGIPIGSGAVESAIRRIVNQRMKGNGIFWYPDNAQRMFFIRCQLLSGRWQAFIKALLCPNQILVQTPAALSWAA